MKKTTDKTVVVIARRAKPDEAISVRRLLRSPRSLAMTTVFLLCMAPLYAADRGQAPQRSLEWHTDFADGLFIRGMYDSAIDEYEKIIKSTKDDDIKRTTEFKIAEARLKKGDLKKAFDAFSDLEKKYLKHADRFMAVFYQALIRYEEKKYEEALVHCDRIAREEVSDATAARMDYYRGMCLKALERYDQAIAAFQEVSDNQTVQLRARAMQEIARVYELKGETANMNETLKELIRAYPDNTEAEKIFLALGRSYFEAGDFEQSLQYFYKAEEEGVENGDRILLNYGIIKNEFELKHFDKVIERAQPFIAQEFDRLIKSEIMYLYAAALFQMEQLPEAAAVIKDILDKFPVTALTDDVLMQGLWITFEGRDRTQFEEYLKRLERDHADIIGRAEAYFLKAELLFEEEKYKDAAPYYAKALEVNPVFRFADLAAYRNALCLKRSGDNAAAFDAFVKYSNAGTEASGASREYLRQALLEVIALGEQLGKWQAVHDACVRYLAQYAAAENREDILIKKAQMEYELAQFDDMQATLTAVRDQFPATTRAREVFYNLGRNAVRLERYEEAVNALREAQAAENFSGLISDEEVVLALGIAQYFAGNFDEACQLLAQTFAGTLRGDIPTDILVWLGEYEAGAGEYAQAMEMYTYLLNAKPLGPSGHSSANNTGGPTRPWKGETKGTGTSPLREGGEAALADSGGFELHERILYKLATWQLAQGELQAALDSFEDFIKRFPESDLVLFARIGIAECKEGMDLLDEAEALYQELSNAEVPYIKARASRGLGNIYYARGNKEEAVRSYMFVTILFDDDEIVPELMLRSVQIYIELGQLENAMNVNEEFKQRFPDHPLSPEFEALIRKKS